MSKVTKRDIKLLESGIGMNWSDMKKIETRLNREMNEMAQRLEALEEFATHADNLITKLNHTLPSAKLKSKTLDQSVFDNLDEKWQFAAVNEDGRAHRCTHGAEVILERGEFYCGRLDFEYELIGAGYDTTNWKNSLIEREKVELTGSDYYYSSITSGLLESGSKMVMCFVSDISEANAISEKRAEVITSLDVEFNDFDGYGWKYAVSINNQCEPLTAKDVGL